MKRLSSDIILKTEGGKKPIELITDSGQDLIVNPIGGYWRGNKQMVEWAKKYRSSDKEYGAYTTIDNDYFLWNEGQDKAVEPSDKNWEIIRQYPLTLHLNMHVHPLTSPEKKKLYKTYEKQNALKWADPDTNTFSSADFYVFVNNKFFESICIDSRHYYVLQPPIIGWDAFEEEYAYSDVYQLKLEEFEEKRNIFIKETAEILWNTYGWNLEKIWEETYHANMLDLSKEYRIPYARYLDAEF